ncbi:AT-rich interactive domain-containing protein 2 [Mactra antiquata]
MLAVMSKNSNKDLRRFEQEKREFIDGLRNFHYNRGTRFQFVPRCGNIEVDLYLLYQKVTSRGGWKKVTENQKWDEVLEELNIPKRCLNADQAVKNIYFRYLNTYEQIHFHGEDPKAVDARRDDDGPVRKKICGPQYGVAMSYNYAQHDVAANLRAGYGLCTTYAKHSSYDKLEKALLSGLPNEVDFVINVCTLLSNESKHTLRLDKCAVLTDLLLAHIGIFEEDDIAMEKLYENGWKKNSGRDFIRFWFDTIQHKEARELISFTREDSRDFCGKEVLQMGRNLGVEDREGIRITQIAIIIRNLSFDLDNMKYLANHDNVFRFLYLCLYCSYGTLRQLALDTLGNLAAQIILDPADTFKSQAVLDLLVECITSTDKLAVVSGLEMVSKLSRQEENEYVLSEHLDTRLYEEIAKYLTISDIQLIVYSLEALYQLSEIGEETNSKIAEVSNTVDTLVSLITVEAQSFGPNSLIGIKVVEYCPPPHLTGGVTESTSGAVGPPPGSGTPQPSQSQPPGQHGSMVPANSLNKGEKGSSPEAPVGPSPMETTTCNWMKATYDMCESAVSSHMTMYKEYLTFCKKFQLNQPLASQEFFKCLRIVFPKCTNCMAVKEGGSREMCVLGIKKREQQLQFSISCPVSKPACSVTLAPSLPTVRPPSNAVHSPNLAQRLASPLPRPGVSMPMRPPIMPQPPIFKLGTSGQHQVQVRNEVSNTGNTVTAPICTISGAVLAQGYMSTQESTQSVINTPTSSKTKQAIKKKTISKKNAPILPRPDQNTPGNLQNIVPRMASTSGIGQQTVVQQPMLQNVQITTQDLVYQDAQNPEAKVMVKTLLAKKIRQGNVIIQQPVSGVMNVDLGGGGDGQTIQYQTSFPQNVQQTAYIQYAPQQGTVQTSGQTFIHSQPTSQVQTFVVQQGDMYVQGQLPSSSLNTQIVAQQQPVVMAPQQQIIAQPQVIVSQQPMVMSQQPMMVSQQQYVTQQPTLQAQIIPQFVSQHQVIMQPSAEQLQGQTPLQMSSSFSSVPTTISALPSSVVSSSESIVCVSASHLNEHSSDINSISNSNNLLSQDTAVYSVCGQVNESVIQSTLNDSDKPSSVVCNVNNSASVMAEASDAVEELESAVGSIMEDNNDGQDSHEEPVMIENDGNELMFEQNQFTNVNSTTEIYDTDEAAMAVEQLEQTDNSGEMNECENIDLSETQVTLEISEEMDENCAMLTDQLEAEVNVANGTVEYNVESIEKGNEISSDSPLISSTINVPIVSENGLLEQDFEARMAVENLLKAVEFKRSTTDDDSIEANVNMLLCQQENPSSVKTNSSVGENENGNEDSRDSVPSESQNIDKNFVVNHNGSSYTTKSSDKNSHGLHNGIDNDLTDKPLLNGDLSSPECPSVPSPSAVNGRKPTELVNGISDEDLDKKAIDKLIRINGVVNHKVSPKLDESKTDSVICEEKMDEFNEEQSEDVKPEENEVTQNENEVIANKTEDILAQSIIDSRIDKNSNDGIDQSLKVDNCEKDQDSVTEGDILAQSILENDIQPSECEMPDTEPTSVTAVVKQIIPSTMYGNIMTVQINNSTIPITFTNNALISSKNTIGNQINVCNSRHIPTPEGARDCELSCDSTNSSIMASDISVSVSDKHSITVNQSKSSHKDSKKSLTSPKSSESKKSKSKKRSRSKSGGSASNESRPSSVTSPATSTSSLPEYMCEWTQCRQCFNNAKSVFHHVCSAHLKTEYDGLCKWEGCETLVRKRWSLFTHVQDHHCSENSLRVAAQRRLQSFQTGQKIAAPTIPAMVYPNDAANQAIKRFLPKPPYPEFLEGREGPVTKHIRLTSALILRNLAKYSAAGRSLLRKHERVISYTCMSAVESSTALAKCLHEIVQDQ